MLIFDRNKNLIIELDSMPSHDIPRLDKMARLGSFFNIQHSLKTGNTVDFDNEWKICCPNNDERLQ